MLEVVLDDDVRDGVKDELDVVSVGGAREVRVDLFRLAALVQVLELLRFSNCSWMYADASS